MHLQEYIPTVIILSPDIGREWYALGGIVIDGHHKLQAAAEIGSPVRVILVENKLHSGFYRKDCHCEGCTSKKKGVPLAWASEKKKYVKDWIKIMREYERRMKKYADERNNKRNIKRNTKRNRKRNIKRNIKRNTKRNTQVEKEQLYEDFIEDEFTKNYFSKMTFKAKVELSYPHTTKGKYTTHCNPKQTKNSQKHLKDGIYKRKIRKNQ